MSRAQQVEVSVILPAYNCEAWIDDTLQSLDEQDFPSYEIIVVDDGSTDSTAYKIRSFVPRGKLRYVWQENAGAGAARNRGMEEAKGRFFLFVDADDLFAPNMISCLYGAAQASGADITVGDAVAFGSNRADVLYSISGHAGLREGTYVVDANIRRKLFQTFRGAPWGKLFRADFVCGHSLEFQSLHHSNDTLFVRSAFALATTVCVVDKTLVYYRVSSGKSLRDTAVEEPLCDLIALDSLRTSLQDRGILDRDLRRSLDNLCLDMAVWDISALSVASTEAVRVFTDALYNDYEPKWQTKGLSYPYIYSLSRFLSYRRMHRVTPAGLSWVFVVKGDNKRRGGRGVLGRLLLGLWLALASAPFSPYRKPVHGRSAKRGIGETRG